MKEQNILRITIPLLLFSLLGLAALQVTLLRNVYEQKEVAFDRSALNALHAVARSLETREVQSKVLRMMGEVPPGRRIIVQASSDSLHDEEFMKQAPGGSLELKIQAQMPYIDSIDRKSVV
jgi:hypothetical protein